MAEFRYVPPPERRRDAVGWYTADELRQCLIDDGVKHRPLGGDIASRARRKVDSLQWMHDAIVRIAAVERKDAEVVFAELVAEIRSRGGTVLIG